MSTNETSYYTEMGFSPNRVAEAFSRFGENHNEKIDWLLLNAHIGKIPKKLKLTDQRSTTVTYYGSQVNFRNTIWTVVSFDQKHALVRLRKIVDVITFKYTWVHISQPDLNWNVVHHNTPPCGTTPSIAWRRKVGNILLTKHGFKNPNDPRIDDICFPCAKIYSAISDDQKLLILAMINFRDRHPLLPDGPKHRLYNEMYELPNAMDRITHEYRIELMSYFVKLLDIYQIPKNIFTKKLLHCMTGNDVYEKILPLFPKTFPAQRLHSMLCHWIKPSYHLLEERDVWISKRQPIVDFEFDYGACTPGNVSINVFFNDMTFVKQSGNSIQPSRLRRQSNLERCFQTLFCHLNGYSMSRLPVDSNFWNKTILNCQAMCKNEVFSLTKITTPLLQTSLLPYQKRALNWLQWRETEAPSISGIGVHRHQLHDGFTFYHNHFGELKHTPPSENIRGGILAQDVGLGKTVEMLALIASSKITKPTLVIMPSAMLKFWSDEAGKHVPSLKTYKYHGAKRNLNDIDNINIVFTTFRIVNDDVVGNMSGNYLQRVEWGRIVLDESHLYSLNMPHWVDAPVDVVRLRSNIRWCMSSTPFVREMKNVEVMFRFFGIGLTNGGCQIDKEFQTRNANIIYDMLGEITYCQSRAHVVDQLPEPASISSIVCKNQHAESYKYLIIAILRDVETHRATGYFSYRQARLFKLYKWWLTVAAVYPGLIPLYAFAEDDNDFKHTTETKTFEAFGGDLDASSKRDCSVQDLIKACADGLEQCTICMDVIERPTMTSCQHVFCYDCIQNCYIHDPYHRKCPLCRQSGVGESLTELTTEAQETVEDLFVRINGPNGKVKIETNIYNVLMLEREKVSNKMNALLSMCQNSKTVVFTRYSAVLGYVLEQLEENGISVMAMKGGMSLKQKQKSVEKFQSDDSVQVFAICLKNFSGSPVLSVARQIVFMEPIDDQVKKKRAIGTVVRIGSTKKVRVVTLLTENTFDDTVYNDIFNHNV